MIYTRSCDNTYINHNNCFCILCLRLSILHFSCNLEIETYSESSSESRDAYMILESGDRLSVKVTQHAAQWSYGSNFQNELMVKIYSKSLVIAIG